VELSRQLTPLEIQAIYDRLAVGGRRHGKPGGLAPQHILAVLLDDADRTQPVAWDLDHPRQGDRGPQGRTVRPGMGRLDLDAGTVRFRQVMLPGLVPRR